MLIGICDDQKPAREYLSRLVKTASDKYSVECFANGHEILDYFGKGKKLDLLFLDIDFKDDMDGMAVAGKIKEKQIASGAAIASLPLIVFVTGMPERMPEAFGVRAFQFVVKPIDEKQFAEVLTQAEREIANIKYQVPGNSVVKLSVGAKQIRFDSSKLIYIESVARKLKIHLDDRMVECYAKMADVADELGSDFCQIHRSYIINLSYVFSYDRTQVELNDGTIIPMSKYKYKEFLDAFMQYGSRRA